MNSPSPSSHCYLLESFYSILLNSTVCGLSTSFTIFSYYSFLALLISSSSTFSGLAYFLLFSSKGSIFLLLYFRHTLKLLYSGVFNFIAFRVITQNILLLKENLLSFVKKLPFLHSHKPILHTHTHPKIIFTFPCASGSPPISQNFAMICLFILHSFLLIHSSVCPLCKRPQFNSWVRKIPWRRNRLPTPVFLGCPGGSAGKESASMWETWV